MAANQDNEDAQHTLGNLYRNGEGKKDAVTKDLNKAMYYYKKASNNGFSYSMFTIGIMYEKGEGVDKSIKNAAMWFKKTYEHDSIKKKVLGLWDSFRIAFLLDDHKDIYYKYRLLGYSSLDLKGFIPKIST
jgi:TPR repeat protein